MKCITITGQWNSSGKNGLAIDNMLYNRIDVLYPGVRHNAFYQGGDAII